MRRRGRLILLCCAAVLMGSAASAAPPDNATSIRFTAAGDYSSTVDNAAVLDTIASAAPDLNLALGDFSYGATGAEQAWCDRVTSRLPAGFPFELVSGNHESNGINGNVNDFSACLANQLPGLVGTYGRQWYVDVPEGHPLVRYVMISPGLTFPDGTYSYDAGTPRYTWTANAIDGARASGIPWVVVGMHKPCVSIGVYSCDPGADITNLMLDRKVDLVLNGHEHMYQRTKQLALGAGCATLTIGSYNPSCVKDGGNDLAAGAGTVFATVGTGGIAQRDVNNADPEAPYFVTASGANQNQTFGVLDVSVDATSLRARFDRASGGTFSDAFTLTKGAAPANQPPTARFTSTTSGLTASFDGTSSSDVEGPVASYAWTFGDGSAGTGATVQHPYAAAGSYDVTLTVTDGTGATSSVTHSVTVTAGQTAQVLASDDFGRTLSSGWGSADVGGTWKLGGTSAQSGVSSGTGRLSILKASSGPPAYLESVSSSDLDLSLTLTPDKVPAGSSARIDHSLITRRIPGAGDYRSMVTLQTGGTVRVGFTRTNADSSQVTLGTNVTVPGLTYAAGTTLKVRAQATGTSPTTLRTKVWRADAAEPTSWANTTTDTSAGLQAKGSIGLAPYLSSSATNAPIVLRYDALRAVTASTLP